jgi:hypothetical protein
MCDRSSIVLNRAFNHISAIMAPVSLVTDEQLEASLSAHSLKEHNGTANGRTNGTHTRTEASYHTDGPVKPTGALEHLESFDITPVIGREFPTANLVDILQASNAEELLRELAYTSKTCQSSNLAHD